MNEKKEKKPRKLYNYLFWVFLVIFLVSTGLILKDKIREWQIQKEYEDMLGKNTEDSESNSSDGGSENTEEETEHDELEKLGIEVPKLNIDWAALQAQYKHMIAWIHIPGTHISYPVMWNPDDDDFYILHNMDGSDGLPGAIYVQSTVNGIDFTDNLTIIYGHNMKSTVMFSELLNYQNAKFFDTYRYVYIYTPETVLVYDVVSEFVNNDEHLYYKFGTNSKNGFQKYIDFVMGQPDLKSNKREDVIVNADTHMIAMSTCVEWGDDPRRYIVSAVLVNPSALDVYLTEEAK